MASAALSELPPLDEMFLVGIWMETVLYGINFVVFCGTVRVLYKRSQDKARNNSTRFLAFMTTLLFLFSTTYVAICLRQLLEAFIYGPPGMATLYFANEPNRLAITKLVLYELNVCTQNLILIWRLWVVFNNNWLVVIFPCVLECLHLVGGFIANARGAKPSIPIFDAIIHRWSIVSWVMDLSLNIGVTTCIALRIWTMQRRVVGRVHRYNSVIWTLVESGVLFSTATLVTVCLYLSGNHLVVAAIDVTVQLATLAPMLILVRVGMGLTHGGSAKNESFSTPSGSTAVGSRTMEFSSRPSRRLVFDRSQTSDFEGDYQLDSITQEDLGPEKEHGVLITRQVDTV